MRALSPFGALEFESAARLPSAADPTGRLSDAQDRSYTGGEIAPLAFSNGERIT